MSFDVGIDHLVDVEIIGRGGFGAVYAATDTRFDRRVAVKVLGRSLSDKDRLAFERECKIMGRMSDHPNVVTVYEAGYNASDSPYLIMELVEGGTLADRLRTVGPLPWATAVEVVIPVADALGAGHAQGIEHRDVKPENILMAGNQPRLTDFGIARLRDATGATSTHITASWLHTPPETFGNKRDERSDIYSLVSTLQTLITGRAPFYAADDESLSPLMYRLLNQPPPELPPHLGPPALAEVLRRGLAKNPAERPQTTDELVAQLRAAAAAAGSAGVVVSGPTPDPTTRIAIADPSTTETTALPLFGGTGAPSVATASSVATVAPFGATAPPGDVTSPPLAAVGVGVGSGRPRRGLLAVIGLAVAAAVATPGLLLLSGGPDSNPGSVTTGTSGPAGSDGDPQAPVTALVTDGSTSTVSVGGSSGAGGSTTATTGRVTTGQTTAGRVTTGQTTTPTTAERTTASAGRTTTTAGRTTTTAGRTTTTSGRTTTTRRGTTTTRRGTTTTVSSTTTTVPSSTTTGTAPTTTEPTTTEAPTTSRVTVTRPPSTLTVPTITIPPITLVPSP